MVWTGGPYPLVFHATLYEGQCSNCWALLLLTRRPHPPQSCLRKVRLQMSSELSPASTPTPTHNRGWAKGRGLWSRLPCLAVTVGARLFQATCHVGASTVAVGERRVGFLPVTLFSSGYLQRKLSSTRGHRSLGPGKCRRGLIQLSAPTALIHREGSLAQCDFPYLKLHSFSRDFCAMSLCIWCLLVVLSSTTTMEGR